jgi:hypothetical protein
MATQTTQTKSAERAAERVIESHAAAAELQDKAVAESKKARAAHLASYEELVLSLADSYEKAAGATEVEWVTRIATAQADVTRELTRAYTSAARALVAE